MAPVVEGLEFSQVKYNEAELVVFVYRLDYLFFQAEDGIRDDLVTGVQTCALPISSAGAAPLSSASIQELRWSRVASSIWAFSSGTIGRRERISRSAWDFVMRRKTIFMTGEISLPGSVWHGHPVELSGRQPKHCFSPASVCSTIASTSPIRSLHC